MATKLNVEVITKIASLMAEGMSMGDAASLQGIAPATLEKWLGGEDITEFAASLPDFVPQIRNALAFREVYLERFHKKGRGKTSGAVDNPDTTPVSLLMKKSFVKTWLNTVIRRAEAECKEKHITNIRDAGKKSWQASAWFLERSFPERYALRTKTDINNNTRITVVTNTPRPKRGKEAKRNGADNG